MTLCSQSIMRQAYRVTARKFSTALKTKDVHEEPMESFRTLESNPVNHNESHLNRFYTVPPGIKNKIFQFGGFPNEFQKQAKTFAEHAILVRNPAVEIISYLNQTDYTRPINKYVLYGKLGAGKSITLAHVLHYAYMNKMILVHVPWPNIWFRFPKEQAPSPLHEGYTDLPIDAGTWLLHFKTQNEALLSELDLKLSKTYEWSTRESSIGGTPLLDFLAFGINRIKFACGVVEALMEELKIHSIAGKCKTFVAIDGYNAFLSEQSCVFADKKVVIPPKNISLTKAFTSITKYDWCNGAVLLTVDARASKDRRDSDLPRYLLGKEGFESLDPFLPVQVEDYTKDEFETVVEYYKNRKWIRKLTPEGQQEIYLLSNANPLKLMTVCTPL